MTALDVFAVAVILTLIGTVLSVAIFIGYLPGRIAKHRNHPQAEAIAVCGWCGLLTMGLLLPVAYVWAFYRPYAQVQSDKDEASGLAPASSSSVSGSDEEAVQ